MSTGTAAANKPTTFSEANEELYIPNGEETFDPFFSEIEYAEWNDAELNAEIWEQGKVKLSSSGIIFFEDSFHTVLPPKIKDAVESWKRPHEVFPEANLTVYDPQNEDFALNVSSPVAQCYIFQSFIENLTTLQYIAWRYGFPVELETPLFVPNTQGEPWRPWHHVYAMCKAGKGTVHKPLYCPYGKYILRLFYMGSWRRFVVDDQIPCDKAGNCMLPVTQVSGELWPIILMKGLLKIFFFQHCVSDLPLLSIFTGWTMCSLMVQNKAYEEVWRRLVLLTRKHEPSEKEDEDKTIQGVLKKETTKKNSIKDSDEGRDEGCCFVIANLEFPEEQIKKTMVVTVNRDSPLVKANKRESTKPWKKIRWVYWALKKGLWMDKSQLPPYRRIYCINFAEEMGRLLMPDPKLESVFFDIDLDENESTSSENNKGLEIEEWYDYNKFYDYLSSLDVYFKPSSFTSNFKVSCLLPAKPPISGKREESAAEGKTSMKSHSSPNTFFFSSVLPRNYNEPPLLFCESATGIFISLTLSVFSTCFKNHSLNLNDPDFLKFSLGSLLIERFDWRKPEQGDIIGATKTIGSSSIWLCLKPGRHVFKLWLICEVPYVITVNSNVEVVIHKGPKIRFLLKNEGARILYYINNVSDAFISLTQKFGKPDLPESLKEFYSIIKPGNDSAPEYSKKMDEFIKTFLNCILSCLKGVITNADEVKIMMQALQSLFFDPRIYCELPRSQSPVYGNNNKKPPKKLESVIQDSSLSETFSFLSSCAEITKITLIQKVFRGYRVRLLWKWQTPARKEFKPLTERLKKICDTIFIPSKREVEVGKLIRRVLMVNPNLLDTFKFHGDFQNTIDVQEYTGKMVNVEPFAWVPIARFLIVCNSDLPVPCAFYLSCNLEQFVIQGVDNDTNKEIFRLTNYLSPHYYHRNGKGYTIFVHGWNEAKPKTVNWRLQMVRMKYFDMLCLCNAAMSQCNLTSLPAIEVFEIKNFYVPNQRARICRCLIKIHKRTFLTLRLSTSSEVVFEVIISRDKRFTSSESESGTSKEILTKLNSSTGAVLMPAVFLEHFENPYCGESDVDYTVYVLEAYVLYNSWPLTKHEWGVIEPFRVNGEAWRESSESFQLRKGGNESRRKFSRISKRTLSETKPVESPFWMLQFVIESQGGDLSAQQMVIEEDKSFAESVKNMKLQWEEKDPGRRSRGNDLRRNFLHAVWLEKRNVIGEGEGEFEISKEDEENFSDFNLLLRRMSSFSYLLEDTQPQKFNKSPRILPDMPTNELLFKYKKPAFAGPVVSLESGSTEILYSDIELTDTMMEETEEHLLDFLTQCVHYREIMTSHTNDEQKLSSQLMEEAYDGRIKAIRQMSKAAA